MLTAAADVFAGYAVAGLFTEAQASGLRGELLAPLREPISFLLLGASMMVYAGGVVLNDVFDRELDAKERPERPIPSGRISPASATLFGSSLLVGALGLGFTARFVSGLLVALIAICAVVYDAWGKHRRFLGPVNMGLCRALNLLLGISIVPGAVGLRWYVALIPLVYIVAVTTMSRGEVHGGSRRVGAVCCGLLVLVVLSYGLLALTPGFRVVVGGSFLVLFVVRVFPAFWRAAREPRPELIRTAVKVGVLSIVLHDAVLAGGYGGVLAGLIVLALRPAATLVARLFTVT